MRPSIAIFQLIPMCIYFTEMYLNCNGAKASFKWVTPGAAAALAFTRLVTPRIHREDLLEIVTSMMDDWIAQQDKKVRWIMKKYATMSTRVTALTFILVGVIVGVYISMALTAIIVRSRKIDNETDTGTNVTRKNDIQSCVFRSESSREVFLIVQAMQMLVTGMLTFGTTSFFFGLAMHLCSQFDALSVKLSEFQIDQAQQVINEAVQRHCHLIRLSDRMEESFNASVLMYLFVTTTLMCIDGKAPLNSLSNISVRMIETKTFF